VPPATLTVLITHPSVLRGDSRRELYNSIIGALESLGPEWHHSITHIDDGNLVISFRRGLAGRVRAAEESSPFLPG